ncbi:aminotransferase class V-fold PLP-dependent enzyme [Acetobacteraceae bacterium]|nr:aminotransferase class V-fold PLP-dependent enzyme [Acetobacteraceae bacterium]
MIYLDANASEVPRPNVVKTAYEIALAAGNPASVHRAGNQAKRHLEMARENVAAFFQRESENCIFTSGASEANALLLESFLKTKSGKRHQIFVGATEHPSILNSLPETAKIIPVNDQGAHDLDWLRSELQEDQKRDVSLSPLICVMVANNETGVYSDIDGFLKLAKEFDAFLHLDAVQALGRGWKPPPTEGVKVSFSLSGHKMGGLLGAGALVVSHPDEIIPIFKAGGQEGGKRGGTPALPAIVALSEALKEAQSQNWSEILRLRKSLESSVNILGAKLVAPQSQRLPNTSAFVLEGIASQAQLMTMDLAGICVSAGSACASGKMGASPVLKAMGLEQQAGHVMRVSLPWNCTQEAIEHFLKAYRPLAERAQQKKKDKRDNYDLP